MDWNLLEQKAGSLKDGLIQTIKKIMAESQEENIIDADPILPASVEALLNPEFNVVVCGEVKRGKSTFINSIIGENLLPTGNKETTSQVFRISPSEEESFSLVFKDGTSESITKQQLWRYGSQTDADLLGEPLFNGRRLDYIQVNYPVEFLPKGVNLVDTPGLGALYKAHTEITEDYISRSDVVVFILDVNQPLVQQEKEFLQKVFSVTKYVLFVMTKIDSVDNYLWVELIRRSEILLIDAFEKDCYSVPKIFPIASTVLLNAKQENDESIKEMLLEDSLFLQVRSELLSAIYKAVGLSRNHFAYTEAVKYFSVASRSIEEQLKMVANENEKEQTFLKAEKTRILNEFNSNWGPSSIKRKEILQEASLILNATKAECFQLFDRNAQVYQDFIREIDALSTSKEAKDYSEKMGNAVVTKINLKWQSITGAAQAKILAIFQKYKTEVSLSGSSDLSLVTKEININIADSHLGGTIQGMIKTSLPCMGTYAAGSYILSIVGMTVPVSLPVILLGTAIWGAFKGKTNAVEQELVKIKNELKNHLENIFVNARHQMTEVSVVDVKYRSAIDAFTAELLISVEKSVSDYYEQSKKQFEDEKSRLEIQSKLKGTERRKELENLNRQRKNWLIIADELKSHSVSIEELKKILA